MLLDNDTQGVNGSEAVSVGDKFEVPLLEGAIIGAINLLLSIIGTFGNFLIIFAILKTPQLRQRPSNFLLLSLAVADLVMTMVAQPLFAAYVLLKAVANQCSLGVDMAYFLAATLSGGSSTSHLAAISIDRALAIVKHHKHRSIMKKWLKLILLLCWGLVIVAIIGYITVKITDSGKTAARTFSILIATYVGTNFHIIFGSYVIILYRVVNPKVQPTTGAIISSAREKAMEKRVSGTIAIVIFFFVACWFPILGYRISHPYTSAHCSFDLTHSCVRTLCLANSSMNFIIYSLRIKQFRTAYVRIINKMVQPFRQIVRRCFSILSPEQQDTNATPITGASAPLSINMQSLSKEMKDLSETIQEN